MCRDFTPFPFVIDKSEDVNRRNPRFLMAWPGHFFGRCWASEIPETVRFAFVKCHEWLTRRSAGK
jgi:hypothetical protein